MKTWNIGLITEPFNCPLAGIGTATFETIRHVLEKSAREKYPFRFFLLNWKKNESVEAWIKQYPNVEERLIANWCALFSKSYGWYLSLPFALRPLKLDLLHNLSQRPTFFPMPCKYIFSVYDLFPLIFPRYAPVVNVLVHWLFMEQTLRKANRIVTCSQCSGNDIRLYFPFIQAHQITHVPLAVPEMKSESHLQGTFPKTKMNLDNPFLLFVSTIEYKKNILTLFLAFRRLLNDFPKMQLILVGKKGYGADFILKHIQRLSLTDHVVYLDYVPRNALHNLYRKALLFVYPSLHEGFGLAPLEAMSLGTAVITSDQKALKETLQDGASLCPPLDDRCLYEQMKYLIANDQKRAELIEKGRRIALSYDWEKTADMLIQVYKETLLI